MFDSYTSVCWHKFIGQWLKIILCGLSLWNMELEIVALVLDLLLLSSGFLLWFLVSGSVTDTTLFGTLLPFRTLPKLIGIRGCEEEEL